MYVVVCASLRDVYVTIGRNLNSAYCVRLPIHDCAFHMACFDSIHVHCRLQYTALSIFNTAHEFRADWQTFLSTLMLLKSMQISLSAKALVQWNL
jgi:hypothetical protein